MHRQEVAWLVPRLRALAAGGDPVIVGGDFSLTDQTPGVRRLLDAGYASAYRQAGWGIDLTYPAVVRARIVFFPLIGIDHLLVSRPSGRAPPASGPKAGPRSAAPSSPTSSAARAADPPPLPGGSTPGAGRTAGGGGAQWAP